jgi:hypothetical protein
VKRVIELGRDLPGKLLQQAHHARAVLVDGQAEAQAKFGVILEQRVCPRRTATLSRRWCTA